MAGFLTIVVDQGADYSQVMSYREQTDPEQCANEAAPVDIRGWTAKMQIRKTVGSPVIIELTDTNGGIEIENDVNGNFTINITDVQSAPLNDGPYMYDLFLTRPDTIVEKVLYGTVIVNKAVTV